MQRRRLQVIAVNSVVLHFVSHIECEHKHFCCAQGFLSELCQVGKPLQDAGPIHIRTEFLRYLLIAQVFGYLRVAATSCDVAAFSYCALNGVGEARVH
jgi:hypothetical protein